MTFISLITFLGVLLVGGAAGFAYHAARSKRLVQSSEQKRAAILSKAQEEAKHLIDEASQDVSQHQVQKDEDFLIQTERVKRLEERIRAKEDHARRRIQSAQQKKDNVGQAEQELENIRTQIADARGQEVQGLSKACGVPVDSAIETVLQQITEELEHDKLERLHRLNQFIEEDAETKAQAILLNAIQRYSLPANRESRSMLIDLEDEKARERLLGTDNAAVAKLQELTGVECEMDNETHVLLIHGYDLLKRYIAKSAVEYVLKKKKPVTLQDIEEGVRVTSQKVHSTMDELGRKTLKDLGIHDFPPAMTRIVGRLAYRTSFGQNILSHSTEVACFSALLAGEVGADVGICKRAGLLHDLGKGIDADVEGPHDVLSRDIGVKLGLDPIIIHAAYAHHEQVDYVRIEDILVQVADAISASRPGARQEATEKYIERIQELELLASSFNGVSKAYAIQAGREIRVIVEPEEVSDEDAARIAKEIVLKIEEQMTYPGEIMVHVIRETAAVDYAR